MMWASLLLGLIFLCHVSNIIRYVSRFIPAGKWAGMVKLAQEGRVELWSCGSYAGVWPRILQASVDGGQYTDVPGHVWEKLALAQSRK